ncbi:fluoride efflux transporter FluC [Haliea atlantica]|jgi:CrcB protein|nr:fluoride efflux transporter CrcB [Haliea sp.]MAL96739.1 fluoride efflux transporter CrcB [Haliea sp.]|tara:strand:+ start:3763 stop:4152 length:390 start_codon:yes stop_codon:yes gene_type:complete
MLLNTLSLVALGGAMGSALRYLVVYAAARCWPQAQLPWGTLLVNLLGSIAIGLLYVLLVERHGGSPAWRALLMTGLLGGFTTFSTFALESASLWEAGSLATALAYMLASLVSCVLGVVLALALGRTLLL